jgi:hypothetical protein
VIDLVAIVHGVAALHVSGEVKKKRRLPKQPPQIQGVSSVNPVN